MGVGSGSRLLSVVVGGASYGEAEESGCADERRARRGPAAQPQASPLKSWIEEELGQDARDHAQVGLAMALAACAVGVPVSDVLASTRRNTGASLARHTAMYLCHVAFEMSLQRVAVAFRRDRSTVAHACHQMEDRRDDPKVDAWLDALERAVRTAPLSPTMTPDMPARRGTGE